MNRRCQDCEAWQPRKPYEKFGECRMLPPQQPRGPGSSAGVRGWWPWTGKDDWCLSLEGEGRIGGEFEAAGDLYRGADALGG